MTRAMTAAEYLAVQRGAIRRRGAARVRPEADIQRGIVAYLRAILAPGAVVHHSNNNVRAGGRAAQVQGGILKAAGVVAGYPDLTVIAQRGHNLGPGIMLLEVKADGGTLAAEQRAIRDLCAAVGVPWALVRSEQEAIEALEAEGFASRRAGRGA